MLMKIDRDRASTFRSATTIASYMSINRVDVQQAVVWWLKVGWEGSPPHFIAFFFFFIFFDDPVPHLVLMGALCFFLVSSGYWSECSSL